LLLGVQIESITCDGHKSLLKAIRLKCPQVVLQRCLIHIQRMCRIWLSNRPKSEAGKQLLRIVSSVHSIENTIQRDIWIVELVRWYEAHKDFINQKTINPQTGRYWFTHKMVRRSFTVIKKALPNMFNYLDNLRIPRTTNGIESFFAHLKGHLNIHRGLSRKHRREYIQWYLYFKNRQRFS